MERLKRQQDIAEAAASDNTDQSELKTRQKFLIQKFYNNFIKRKMEKEMKNNTKLEDAYKRMKESTVYIYIYIYMDVGHWRCARNGKEIFD